MISAICLLLLFFTIIVYYGLYSLLFMLNLYITLLFSLTFALSLLMSLSHSLSLHFPLSLSYFRSHFPTPFSIVFLAFFSCPSPPLSIPAPFYFPFLSCSNTLLLLTLSFFFVLPYVCSYNSSFSSNFIYLFTSLILFKHSRSSSNECAGSTLPSLLHPDPNPDPSCCFC